MRDVLLPQDIPGKLFLHSMPGRDEPYEDICQAILQQGIRCVVCLSPLQEIAQQSPDYAEAISTRRLAWQHEYFPVPDYGVPAEVQAFWQLAQRLATLLQTGERLLIHCGAGIGRTGTCAIGVLLALAVPLCDAYTTVRMAGSSPETPVQRQLLAWLASQGGNRA